MRIGFYPKLALDGIKKNRRMYFPYLLTCIGMVMMYYIVMFLYGSEVVLEMRGGGTITGMLFLGGWVIAVFSGIFLFYTNSFLLRRRKKEFGLYNMLGMGKRHIAVILFWETLFIYLISLAAGLAGGIAFSKLAELGLVNIMHGEAGYRFSLSVEAIMMSAAVFGIIFILLFFNALRQIKHSTAIALLRSENVGEKPPKANWVLGVSGVVLLAAAYAIALKIEDPISALLLFFAAVLMVIVGTYLLMIAGSVMLCRILQKNKKYYYQPNHFVSVSSMAYRMKRNGAGLASVCILATMVLVMVSSTTSLYFGTGDALKQRYPREICAEVLLRTDKGMDLEETIDEIRTDIAEAAEKSGAEIKNVQAYRRASISGIVRDGVVETDVSKVSLTADMYADVFMFDFISLADYNAMTGKNETLEEDEILLEGQWKQFSGDTLSFNGGKSFHIKKTVDPFISMSSAVQVVSVITADLDSSVQGIQDFVDRNGNQFLVLSWHYNFDTNLTEEEQVMLYQTLRDTVKVQTTEENDAVMSFRLESRVEQQDYLYAVNGSFLYLGIVLSIVFLFAAVLIIYYKQISEGYEDQARFEIMRKVGMTKKEIRRSINSQLLTVFFLPLLLAGLHLIAAFPVIQKLLLLFNLNNIGLFAGTTAGCFAVFTLFYGLVYRATSNAYYQIVSGL